MPKKWEHLVFPLAPAGEPVDSGEDFKKRLDQLGDLGWELCTIELGWAFMKREKHEQSIRFHRTPAEVAQDQ